MALRPATTFRSARPQSVIGTSATLSDNKTPTNGVDTTKIKAKRDFEPAARVGAILGDMMLVYGKIGCANAKV